MEAPHQKEPIKIKTYECYTKFQEAKPAHRSNLINKQLGYDCIVEPEGDDLTIKIKNCINSARPNSELFKRIAKPLINNMKNDVDQLLFFTSLDPVCRIETSIGLPTNPGLFLIIGLTYLDEKYKESYQRCDVQFSFLQFKDSQMYDLLCYTNQPLIPQGSKGEKILFREHWARVSTFNQFIKLFKVALFNNKERDFQSTIPQNKYKSTFIMKARWKIYNEEGQLIRCQETTLVDYEPNCQKECSNIKEKQVGKTILEYILIDMHNGNPALKPMHYHMVQENHLLMMINQFLSRPSDQRDCQMVGGQVTFFNCIPADQASFAACHQYLSHITSTIGDSFQAKVAPKPKQSKHLNLPYVQSQLLTIVKGISFNTYTSLRNFHSFKQQLVSELKRGRNVLKQLRRAIIAAIKEKLRLKFMKNEFLACQMKLIGSCIKSDHFKDFYNAKSYIQLEREVTIKTENIKEEIKNKSKTLVEVQKKYYHIKKRQAESNLKCQKQPNKKGPQHTTMDNTTNWSNHLSMQLTKDNWNTKNLAPQTSKFKRLSLLKGDTRPRGDSNQLNELKKLIAYLIEHMFHLWDCNSLFQQRTVANHIEFQQSILFEQNLIVEAINVFMLQMDNINQTEIVYQQENNMYNNNQVGLFRSLNFLGLLAPKKKVQEYEIGKRLVINGVNEKKKGKIGRNVSIEVGKLPSIAAKTPPIVISGHLKLTQLLTNPKLESKLGSFRQ